MLNGKCATLQLARESSSDIFTDVAVVRQTINVVPFRAPVSVAIDGGRTAGLACTSLKMMTFPAAARLARARMQITRECPRQRSGRATQQPHCRHISSC